MILFTLVVPIVSFSQEKICINCKYFKKDFWMENKFGKCALFLREENSKSYLVDGMHILQNDDYYYCSTARGFDSMCGETGNHFQKKNS